MGATVRLAVEDFFDGPYWDLLLLLVGAILSLILQRVAFGDGGRTPQPEPLYLSDLPAATPPAMRAQAYAHASAQARVVVTHKREDDEDPNEVWGWLIIAGIASVVLAAAYLEVRHEIAAGLRALVFLGLGFWLTTFAFLLRRRAIVGMGWAVAIGFAAVVFILARAVVSALAEPQYVAGRNYAELLRAFDACGVSGLIDFDGSRGVTFVLLQLAGVCLYLFAWASAATLLLVLTGMVAVWFRSRPQQLWTRIARVPGPWREHPIGAIVGAVVFALIAWGLAAGTAQRALLGDIQDGPAVSRARARLVDGRIQLYARSDFRARVTIQVRRSGTTVRTVRRQADEGVNHWRVTRANGQTWRRRHYRLRLTARDAKGRTSNPISLSVPGRYPRPDRDRCES